MAACWAIFWSVVTAIGPIWLWALFTIWDINMVGPFHAFAAKKILRLFGRVKWDAKASVNCYICTQSLGFLNNLGYWRDWTSPCHAGKTLQRLFQEVSNRCSSYGLNWASLMEGKDIIQLLYMHSITRVKHMEVVKFFHCLRADACMTDMT